MPINIDSRQYKQNSYFNTEENHLKEKNIVLHAISDEEETLPEPIHSKECPICFETVKEPTSFIDVVSEDTEG